MDDLYYLEDGVYRAVEKGPALGDWSIGYVTEKKGKRKVSVPRHVAIWVHLEKIGPPAHDRGSTAQPTEEKF